MFSACCGGLGTCVAHGLIPAELTARLARDVCGESLLCAPSALVQNPSFVLQSCAAYGGREGRCIAACLPDVAGQANRLEQASCQPGELCAPCFDPLSGEDTGVCRFGADPGPHEPAGAFGRCCGDTGRGVPRQVLARSLADSDLRRLGNDVCAEPNTLCVPQAMLNDANATPAHCQAAGELEGRCVSSCIPEV